MAVSSVLVSVLVVGVILAVLTYLFWYKDKKVGSVFLYEKVGKYERFSGVYPLNIIRTNNTDVYKIGGVINKTIDKPAPEDFYDTSSHHKKIIHITKFSEEDFRIKKRLDDQWFTKVLEPYEEETGEMVEDPETGEMVPEVVTKERFVEIEYSEPLGITQEARDAIRIGLENERSLKEELQNNTFWDKWGQPIMIATLILIMSMTMMSVSKDNAKAIEASAQVCNSQYEKVVEDVKSPTFANNLINKIRQDEINEGAPPK